jgi:flagellar M-ring protein FliF
MEFLRGLIAQTQNYLRGLTASQQLAIASLVALIGVSLLWLVSWASAPALVPLLDQPMSQEEVAKIQERLDAVGIEHEMQGSMLMVRAEDRTRLLGQLSQQRLLPDDISLGFKNLILERSQRFASMREQDRMWNLAISNELARVVRGMEGVKAARVFIDSTTKRGISGPNIKPTASVGITLADGVNLSKGRIYAIASLVSGAVSGLSLHDVQITDSRTAKSGSVPRPEDELAFDDLDDRRNKEKHYEEKVRGYLTHIPNAVVKVFADLAPESKHEMKRTHGKPPLESERTETEKMTRGTLQDEPGMRPNTEVNVNGTIPQESMEKSVTEATFDAHIDETVTTVETPRHRIIDLGAAVSIPKSWLMQVYKGQIGEEELTDEEFDELVADRLERIKKDVMVLLDQEDEAKVRVDWVPDMDGLAFGQVMQAGPTEGMLGYVQAYWDKAGIAALAVISLLMMLMMVRRVGEGPVLPGEEPPAAMGQELGGDAIDGDVLAGEAHESEPLLMGKEVDETTLQAQKVVEEVTELITQDPTASASILQQWLEQGGQ